ncbi:MAG: hypothetical protein J7K73_03880 [Nanoarchaeota archaeon]|nr:hypothetical protein [Nanoarchaeota archaeon]
MKMAAKKRRKATKKKSKTNIQKNIGYWLFLVGVLIAILAGLITPSTTNTTILWVVAVLGLIVGLINVTLKEEVPFLVAALVILNAAGYMSLIPVIGQTLTAILYYIMAFVAPAAIVVALKAIYHFGK